MFNIRVLTFLSLLVMSFATNAATWINTTGKITTETGEPVCAMVLSNGQHMFSCGGKGAYNLRVPLDQSGNVTLMVFASGFEPYRMTLTSGQATTWNVSVPLDTAGKPFAVYYNVTSAKKLGWVTITGDVYLDETPLCAMVLANGQSMFSCGVNKGKYTLVVPLDYLGDITLMSFVSGLSPLRGNLNIPASLLNRKQAERLNGKWSGTIQGVQSGTYTLNGSNTIEFTNYPGEYYVRGVDPAGNSDVIAWYDNETDTTYGGYTLWDFDAGSNYDIVYDFDFDSPNMVSGCAYKYFYNTETWGDCMDFSAKR